MAYENKQIFIVDDDESVCRALSALLATYGFTINTFTSAEDFFRTVPTSVQGCLILDVHMPGLDGWDALLDLLILGSSRPVIMISADRNENFRERALKTGAAAFLQKPLDGQELADLINIAVEEKQKMI